MITRNIWTDRGNTFFSIITHCTKFGNTGLVNGTKATIKQIIFAPGADYKIDLPRFIMVEVDDYAGLFWTY